MEIQILKSEAIEAITKSEIDVQISTAKKYPRDLERVIKNIDFMATQDKETAEMCFYALPRGGKTITGPSVRLAEIIASCWGNLRVGTRLVANDGKTITVQGICHDLESNVAVTMEVQRKITDKSGKTFNEDMQIVTANAAASIAFRNAIYKIVPMAVTGNIIERIKDVAIGKSLDLETSRTNAVEYFKKLGVTEKQILDILNVKEIGQIGKDEILTLKGLKTALAEGTTNLEEAFSVSKKGGKINDMFEKEAQQQESNKNE